MGCGRGGGAPGMDPDVGITGGMAGGTELETGGTTAPSDDDDSDESMYGPR